MICPRCNGFAQLVTDRFGAAVSCLICGHEQHDSPPGDPRADDDHASEAWHARRKRNFDTGAHDWARNYAGRMNSRRVVSD